MSTVTAQELPEAGPPLWCFNIKRNLDGDRKEQAVAIAREVYARKFQTEAPPHEERRTSNSLTLAFPVPLDDIPEPAAVQDEAPPDAPGMGIGDVFGEWRVHAIIPHLDGTFEDDYLIINDKGKTDIMNLSELKALLEDNHD